MAKNLNAYDSHMNFLIRVKWNILVMS